MWPLSTHAKSDPDILASQCEDKNISLVNIEQVETQGTRQIPGLEHLAYAYDHVMALLQLFKSSSKKLRNDEPEMADCVLFQASTSQSYIGIAPVGLRTGDLACLMENMSQAELMNECPIVIVSRGDSRLTGVARSASRLHPTNNDTWQETRKPTVEAETDIMMLQLLAGLPPKKS